MSVVESQRLPPGVWYTPSYTANATQTQLTKNSGVSTLRSITHWAISDVEPQTLSPRVWYTPSYTVNATHAKLSKKIRGFHTIWGTALVGRTGDTPDFPNIYICQVCTYFPRALLISGNYRHRKLRIFPFPSFWNLSFEESCSYQDCTDI